LVTVPDLPTGVTQLEQGRIQAIGLTSISLKWLLEQDPSIDAEVTEPFTPVVDCKEVLGCGAAVFRKEDTDLVEAFNAELKKLKDSGELTKLIEPFGFGAETLPPDDVTTESLCKG
jgi:polar amino acid transport system substrate-binding protein